MHAKFSVLALSLALARCEPSSTLPTRATRARQSTERASASNDALVSLGRSLFFERALSLDRSTSCHDCHSLTNPTSGTTATETSTGIAGQHGTRNAPTVLDAALRRALFWDGRATSLEEQARGPLLNPVEMAMPDERSVVERVRAIPALRARFAAALQRDELTFEDVTTAIAAYERTLVTDESPFDRAQRGVPRAIDARAERGWRTFQRRACVACHGTPTFSNGEAFVRFPLRSVPDLDALFHFTDDLGRMGVTAEAKDRGVFRVPSLRNVGRTAPYFHNGAVAHLAQAVRVMGRAQLATELPDDEVNDIVAFLQSLSGALPPDRLSPPD